MRWKADVVRDDLGGYVLDHLADPAVVVVAGETSSLKRASSPPECRYSGLPGEPRMVLHTTPPSREVNTRPAAPGG